MLAFLIAAFVPSNHLLVRFCGLRLNYSSCHLEETLLTHWTWKKHPILNSIFIDFSFHKYSCKILIKHSCCSPNFWLFLPYLDLYIFFSFCYHLSLERLINEFIILSTVIQFLFYLSFLGFDFCAHFFFFCYY